MRRSSFLPVLSAVRETTRISQLTLNSFAREQAEWAAEQVTASNMLVWLLNERFTTVRSVLFSTASKSDLESLALHSYLANQEFLGW